MTPTERHEITDAINAVTEASLELGLRLANGKPPDSLLSGLEHVQEKLNKARAALAPIFEETTNEERK